MAQTRKVVIVGGSRIPFVRSFTRYRNATNSELVTTVLKSLVDKFQLQGKVLGEIVLGAVIKHSSDWNLARECVLSSGLSADTPAFDLQQACGTSLEAVISVANKIALGQIEVGIGAGTDTNSDAPIGLKRGFSKRLVQTAKAADWKGRIAPWKGISPGDFGLDFPGIIEARTGLSMGQHCEKMAQEWKI